MRTLALEKKVSDGWIPAAVKYHRFSTHQKHALGRGEVVTLNGSDFRRSDWEERKAFRMAARNMNLTR